MNIITCQKFGLATPTYAFGEAGMQLIWSHQTYIGVIRPYQFFLGGRVPDCV